MLPKLVFSFLLFTASFFFPQTIFAAMEVTGVPTEITEDQEFEVMVSLSGLSKSSKYYLKGAFYETTDNYFGLTWNGSTWVTNSTNYKEQLPITTDAYGKWIETVKVKVDKEDTGYKNRGPGSYSFKVARYKHRDDSTSVAPTWSSVFSVVITSTTPATQTSSNIDTSSAQTDTTPSQNQETSPPPVSTPQSVFEISGASSSISADDPNGFAVNVNIAGLSPNTSYYLKCAFHKEGSINYFGYTKVGAEWIKNSISYASQVQITTDGSGNWQGSLTCRPDPEDSGFTGSNNYLFKVGRYTSSGSGSTWSNSQTINITAPAVQESSTSKSSAQTQSSKPSSSQTPSVSTLPPKTETKTTPEIKPQKLLSQISNLVLGTATSSAPVATGEVKTREQPPPPKEETLGKIFLGTGAVLILGAILKPIFAFLKIPLPF